MGNPLQRLSRLPWTSLAITAVLTSIWIFVMEFFLGFGIARSSLVQDTLVLLLSPPLGLIVTLAIGVGAGMLGLYLLEIVYPSLRIDTGVMWALVLCLIVAIALKATLLSEAIPLTLVSPNQTQLIGVVLGVFLKGKPYWR
ncbi:MAG TPA: peptide chain release factor 1 [Coleofasciculaceae cyanobacterium]